MFSWQGSSDDSGSKKVVSKLFWVYWAFTVPLTVVVALGWWLWWHWEKKKFDDDVTAELKAIDGDGEATVEVSEELRGGKTGIYPRGRKSAVQRRTRVKGMNKVEATGV
jgi:hypothetical protein